MDLSIPPTSPSQARLSRNGDLNLDPRLNIDDDLLDHLRRRIQTVTNASAIDQATPNTLFPPTGKTRLSLKTGHDHLLNQALMDPHLVHIPRLAALAARRLARRHLQALGRQPHGALDPEILGLGPLDQLLAHFFQRLHLARRQGDADFVDFLDFFE